MANAQKHLRAGKVDRAIKEFERVVADDPTDVRSKLKMADLYVKGERYDQALRAYSEVARAYATQDHYEKAAAVYRQAMRISPDDAVLYTQLGDAYFRLGRLKDAVRVFQKAQKIYKRNNNDAAQRDILERMVRIDPDDVGLRIQLAERHEKDGYREEAVALFREAAAQLKDEGRVDEYVQVLERLIFLSPQGLEMRKEIVGIYLDRGDERHALKHLQYCFKLNPQDIETLELLGATFHRLGANDKAVLVYAELAALYNRTGLESRAAGAYRAILNIDPTHREARAFLDKPQPQTRVGVQPIPAAPTRPPEPPVYEIELEEIEEHDALDGIEFLDEDSDELVELSPTDHGAGAAAGGFMAFAEDAIRDIEDVADFNQLEAYPEAPAGAEYTDAIAIDISESSLEPLEPELQVEAVTSESAFDGDEQIKQLLTESDVFLKYGLLDRAEEVITKVIQLSPDNLGGREQMRKLLIRTGDKRGSAHQLVEMARISGADTVRANGFILHASELVDAQTLEAMLAGAGVARSAPADTTLPEDDFDDSFILDLSDAIDEGEVQAAQDAEIVYELDIPELDPEEFMLSGESALEPDDAINVDATFEDQIDLPVGTLEIGSESVLDDFSEIDLVLEDAEFVDVDVDVDAVAFDESALLALDAATERPEEIDLHFTAEDADAMFDELFGTGVGEETDASIPSLDLGEGGSSLSQTFESPQTNPGVEISLDEAINNSSLELGKTYKDMGLFSEAIDEFRQAMDDPDAAPAAQYNIALCHLELGAAADARNVLAMLSEDGAAPLSWRTRASEKLMEL